MGRLVHLAVSESMEPTETTSLGLDRQGVCQFLCLESYIRRKHGHRKLELANQAPLLKFVNLHIHPQYQMVCQWIIASLTNEPQRLARYAGFAKGGLAGGLAAAFGTEAGGLTQLNVLAFCFSLQFFGLFCMLLICCKCVQSTNYFKEEMVIAPISVERAHADDLRCVDREMVPHPQDITTDIKAASIKGCT